MLQITVTAPRMLVSNLACTLYYNVQNPFLTEISQWARSEKWRGVSRCNWVSIRGKAVLCKQPAWSLPSDSFKPDLWLARQQLLWRASHKAAAPNHKAAAPNRSLSLLTARWCWQGCPGEPGPPGSPGRWRPCPGSGRQGAGIPGSPPGAAAAGRRGLETSLPSQLCLSLYREGRNAETSQARALDGRSAPKAGTNHVALRGWLLSKFHFVTPHSLWHWSGDRDGKCWFFTTRVFCISSGVEVRGPSCTNQGSFNMLGKGSSFSATLFFMSCLVRPRDNKAFLLSAAQTLFFVPKGEALYLWHYLCSHSWIQGPLLLYFS